jgi:hypothetical protein
MEASPDTEICEVPPEAKMSTEYKEGWNVYLTQVLAISERMIGLCEQAEATDNSNLIVILNKEQEAYDRLATHAKNEGLLELQAMLKHEAKSRRDIIADL